MDAIFGNVHESSVLVVSSLDAFTVCGCVAYRLHLLCTIRLHVAQQRQELCCLTKQGVWLGSQTIRAGKECGPSFATSSITVGES